MTWSAPMTAVAGSVFTASQFNQYVRDNLLQTAPALATAAGQLFVSTAPNQIAARTPTQNTVATSETTAATSYGDLATIGPAVTVTTGTQALVFLFCTAQNSTTGTSLMGYAVSGASSVSASDSQAVGGAFASAAARCSSVVLQSGLTPGSNVFTAKYRTTAGTATFASRNLIVVPL